jgi:outer membrane receptor protein involved in Fe transport
MRRPVAALATFMIAAAPTVAIAQQDPAGSDPDAGPQSGEGPDAGAGEPRPGDDAGARQPDGGTDERETDEREPETGGEEREPGDDIREQAGEEKSEPGVAGAKPAGEKEETPGPSVKGEPDKTESGSSGIQGRVVDARSGQGLGEAPVVAQGKGQALTALTDEQGQYVLRLPAGIYTVSAFQDLYHGSQIDRIRVFRGRFTELILKLEPAGESAFGVDEIEIPYRADTSTAAAQDQLRQESSGIGEGMGAEQMSQQGASDAGSAAARVVGVTLEGSQLMVRGLGGRYARVLLNGVAVPSTDPDVPGADLDMFPASVIESMTVSKAFIPSMPGDFAGGVLMIHTVTFPRDFTLEAGASTGANTQSTFRRRLDYEGSGLDFLGFDDGRRAIPDGIPQERVQISRQGRYQSFEELEAAAELFDNTWQYERITSLPKMGLDFTLGDSFNLRKRKRFGYLTSVGYDYSSNRKTGISRPRPTLAEDGSLQVFNDYQVEKGEDEVQLTALGTSSLDVGANDSLTLLTLFNRSLEDETQLKTGESGELAAGERVEKWQLQFLARTLWFNQLLGEHRNLAGSRLKLKWTGFAALGRRDEPDRRSVIYGPQGGQFRWLEKANSGERFYSELEQVDLGGGADLRFPLWPEGWGTVGGHLHTSGREFLNRRFRLMQDPGNTDQTVYQNPVEELFSEEGIGTVTRMREFTRADDSYDSRQNLYAAFAMLESPIVGPLSFAGGARTEVFSQRVQSRSPFAEEQAEEDAEDNRSGRTDVDVLPGVAFKYALSRTMFLRSAYGMTLGRPQIRELAPYQYYDFLRDRNVQGNPDLKSTTIHNLDLRWEWFFAEAQVVAFTVFGKQFLNPIELQILNPDNYDAQFINADSARNLGAEFELRLGLGQLGRALENFGFGGNLALIWSTVELPPELSGAVKSERRLFGQSPYVLNLSIRHEEPVTRTELALVYNVVGPRISDVGTRVGETVLPDIEEQPFHSLDLVGSWKMDEHFKLKVKAKNLLLDSNDFRQGDFLVQSVDPGVSFALGVSYSE